MKVKELIAALQEAHEESVVELIINNVRYRDVEWNRFPGNQDAPFILFSVKHYQECKKEQN